MAQPVPEDEIDGVAREHLGRLKDGCVLLAHEELQDPNFVSTVVLICVYNNDGAFGLVCNRPSHMPLSEVFDVDIVQQLERRKIYIGGPVQQEALQILQVTDSPAKNAYQVAPRVYLGGEWSALEDILDADQATTRLFLGYSGWGAGQLESEIAAGAWEVFTVNVELLLVGPEDRLVGTASDIREYLSGLA